MRKLVFTLGAMAICLASWTGQSLAQGIPVGGSGLGYDTLDFSDTFTGTDAGGRPDRPYVPAIQPAPAYVIENTYGNPSASFLSASFSFAADGDINGTMAPGFVAGANAYPGGGSVANASGAGSDTGFTQTGGAVDYGVQYYLRDEYWVQVDAVQNPDRVDISSGASVGIFAPNSLSVFFRGDGSGNASLFNGSVDTPIQGQPGFESFNTGIAGSGEWNNYAVRYDRSDQEVELFVNQNTLATIDLTTFAGGIYQGFSNAFVGAGGSGGDRTWTDNFQIGGIGAATGTPPTPHDDPGNLSGLPANLVSFWDFNEASGAVDGRTLDFAYDRVANRDGRFLGTTERVPGLVGVGAGKFNGVAGDGVDVGSDGFSFTDGIAVEAMFATSWDGTTLAELFRKEDGGDRILLSFQPGDFINSGQTVGTSGVAGISLGLNINGAYDELDIAFDGQDGRPALDDVADGQPHHIVGTYDATSGTKAVYLDGELIGSFQYDAGAPLVTGGGADAFIGAVASSEPFNGVLDEVAVYNSALTADDIALHITNIAGGGANYFNAVPEPSACWLLLTGLFAVMRRKRSHTVTS